MLQLRGEEVLLSDQLLETISLEAQLRVHLRKPPIDLSITHKFGHLKAKHDVGESRHATPHDNVARWWITGASEVAAETCDFDDVRGKGLFCGTSLGSIWNEMI